MLEIREATIQDLDAIALIHSITIPYSINAAMGIDRLRDLYLLTLQDKDSLLLIATEDNRVIGFIGGTSQFGNLARGAKCNVSLGQLINIFRKMNPFKLLIAALDLIFLSRAFHKLDDFYYLLSWGMLPNSHPTAGSALFRELLKRVRDSGAQSVIVNVDKNNSKVLRMYRTLGFLPVSKSISELILKKQY
jgi:ribosomal protein S18 acetylase RimI-like enzyme